VDKAAEAKKKADQSKSFMEAEAKAQAEQDAKEAKEALGAADTGCNGGDANKCVDLGRIYGEGKGIDKDPAKSMAAYVKACSLKSKDGCRQAAIGEGDDKKRLDHLVALCDLGDADGCIEGAKLADALVASHALPEPKKLADRDAMKLLKKACALGQVVACTARGVGLVNDDPAAAVESFGKGCDGGEPTSCMQLAGMYKDGKGMKKKDEKKAKELMKKACTAGLKDAC
jgi:TPR repeat protein